MDYIINTYLFYLAAALAISIYRQWQKGTLNLYNKILFSPVIAGFYLLDVALNMTLFNVVMGQSPAKKFSISDRFEVYNQGDYGWKSKVAGFVCGKLLNNIDPTGAHC